LSIRYAGGYQIFNATKLILSDQGNLPLQNINHNGLANMESEHQISLYDENYLEDASFLRLENVTIGYAFKPKSSDASRNLTVFVGADNLFTITNYDGFDPAGYDTGIDAFNVYPLARTYNFGFRMNL
jgi:iron complex outermembrane receptor protein